MKIKLTTLFKSSEVFCGYRLKRASKMHKVFHTTTIIVLEGVNIVQMKNNIFFVQKTSTLENLSILFCYNASNLMNFVVPMVLCDPCNHCSSSKFARAPHNKMAKSKTGILQVCTRFALIFSPNCVGIIKYQAIKPSHTILTPQQIVC